MVNIVNILKRLANAETATLYKGSEFSFASGALAAGKCAYQGIDITVPSDKVLVGAIITSNETSTRPIVWVVGIGDARVYIATYNYWNSSMASKDIKGFPLFTQKLGG